MGHLTFLRIYSGVLKSGDTVYNPGKGKNERVGRLLRMHANEREDVKEIKAGGIVAAVGLKLTTTGDTLCSKKQPVQLESLHVPEPVVGVAIEPDSKPMAEKLAQALGRIAAEDPSFRVERNEETNQTVIRGMGELHLEIIVDRIMREFKVEATVGEPQVAYREAIQAQAQSDTKYAKQSGGRGQYGHVKIDMMPGEAGSGVVFTNSIVGGAIPKEYIRSVEAGARDAAQKGVLAGFPVEDVEINLVDGSYHEVDSSDRAFFIAASMAFKDAAKKAGLGLLEPVMAVEVVTPEEYMGDVMGDLGVRRGKIRDIEATSGTQIVKTHVPLAAMFGYAGDLRSATQGRATFSMEFSHYEPVPAGLAEEVIERVQRQRRGDSRGMAA